jgi:hypothetical protein
MSARSREWRLFVLALAAILPFAVATAVDIQPPKVQVIDRFNVNMVNGQVVQSLPTLSIGGPMGLSHSISVDANEFNFQSYRGFRHKYFGEARNVTLSTDPYFSPQNVLRVSDSSDTAEFRYWSGGALQQSGWGLISGYSYVSHGDERHTLDWDTNYLYWTKPDGTVVRFSRTSPPEAASSALLVDVTYPTGFRIEVWAGGMSVNTNTGFQLKGFYPPDNRPLDKPDKPYLWNAPPASSSGWAQSNPKYIKGINSAIEYCAPTATDCAISNDRPTATFNWPAGMPRTMFLGDSQVSVIDALGRTTTYTYRAYDLAYVEMQGGVVATGQTLDQEYSPRLIGARTLGTPDEFTYDYRNVWVTAGDPYWSTWDVQLQTSGVVTSATRRNLTSGYDMLGRYYDDLLTQSYGSSNGVSAVQVHAHTPNAVGAIYYANTEEGTLTYEDSARNFPSQFQPGFGPRQNFLYERGNLKRITFQQHVPAESTYIEATYPASCTPGTRKTCNQATGIRDARGNWTYYTYHAQSGQVESILRPADPQGIYPETHFEYQQKTAQYYNAANGAWISGSPIWMRTAERYCIDSNYSSRALTATCAANDEVVTRYEYNHNNLLMTGMTVTSADGTLRTCFRYDIYGRQIGKTEPKAGLASCP